MRRGMTHGDDVAALAHSEVEPTVHRGVHLKRCLAFVSQRWLVPKVCTLLLDRAVSQTLQIVCNLDLLCFLNVHVLLWIKWCIYFWWIVENSMYWYDNQRLIFSTNSQQMVLFNKITGQKRKTGISCHVFSFQQSLSFVERFVEKMLSLKYLIFNTFFIIFNNSTKLYAI